ncbi:MAG TPA: hypothetical protein VF272_01285 [Candidatus Saccharimonadia bacterium]
MKVVAKRVVVHYTQSAWTIDIRVDGLILGRRPWTRFDERPFSSKQAVRDRENELTTALLRHLLDVRTDWIELWPDRLKWGMLQPFGSQLYLNPLLTRLRAAPNSQIHQTARLPAVRATVLELPSSAELGIDYWRRCFLRPQDEPLQLVALLDGDPEPVVLEFQVTSLDNNQGREQPYVSVLVRQRNTTRRWQPVRFRVPALNPDKWCVFDYELEDF